MITIEYNIDPVDLLREWAFTYHALQRDTKTQTLAPGFLPYGAQIRQFAADRLAIIENVVASSVQVYFVDLRLNELFDEITMHLLAYANQDRNHPEVVRFLGHRKPSDIKRPILGSQLALMGDFPVKLQTAKTQALRDCEAKLVPLISEGQSAETALRAAELGEASFFKSSPYTAFIDVFNGGRKALFGQIAEIGHKSPELNLGADYPEGFFLRAKRSQAPTVAGEQRTIERLKQELAKHEALLVKLLEEDEGEKLARLDAEKYVLEEEKKKLEAETAALQKQAAEKQALIDALNAKLEPQKP